VKFCKISATSGQVVAWLGVDAGFAL